MLDLLYIFIKAFQRTIKGSYTNLHISYRHFNKSVTIRSNCNYLDTSIF